MSTESSEAVTTPEHLGKLSLVSTAEIALQLYDAERLCQPIVRLTKTHPELEPADAYAIQEGYVAERRKLGARVVGRKIGCTSLALQQYFGINTPDFGHLFDDMRVADGAVIDVSRLIAPMVEPEVAFILSSELEGPGVSREDVLSATSAVMPAIEIIDSRISEWDIRFCDTVADNGSSARFVLGAEMLDFAGLDLASERVTLFRNGAEFDGDAGSAVLGHPANAVAWLANALAQFDRKLLAGEVVLSGSITRAAKVRKGETYEAVFSSIGRVGCRFG